LALLRFIYDPENQKLKIIVLGNIENGHERVAVVPAGHWQAARPRSVIKDSKVLEGYALVGCTVGPGFEFADFEFVSELEGQQTHFTTELSSYRDLL